MSCLLRVSGSSIDWTRKHTELVPQSRHIKCPKLAEMNVKLWVVKKIQIKVLTGDVLVQCFSGREFSAHGPVSMGTAADWMQLGSWKRNISWHKLIGSSDTLAWCSCDPKKRFLCQKAKGAFFSEKPTKAGHLLVTQPHSSRTSSASQGINLNSRDKVVLFPLMLDDFFFSSRSHLIQLH